MFLEDVDTNKDGNISLAEIMEFLDKAMIV